MDAPGAQPRNSAEEIAQAVDRDDVAFPLVVKALYLQWRGPSDDPLRQRYEELYPRALKAFTDQHNGIRDSFYADAFVAGVVLTGTGELFASIWWDEFRFDTRPARELEAKLNDLQVKASLYLAPGHRRICMERLLRLYKSLIQSLRLEYWRWSAKAMSDDLTPHDAHRSDLEQIRRELADVRATYRGAGHARGQVRYFVGAGLGAITILVVTGIVAAVAGKVGHTIWLGALAGGATGALFSVLERLTREKLTVRFETDPLLLSFSGVSRPVVGALSGLALYALIGGDILPIDVPDDVLTKGLFFAALGFLSGFSERLARGLFESTSASLLDAPGEGAEPSAKPAPAAKRTPR